MNYFAHAFEFLEKNADPFFLAGLAVPDWLNVVNRKIKARSKAARKLLDHATLGEDEISVVSGVIQHHADDRWFHEGAAFNSLCLEFTVELRTLLAPDPGFRPSFLGHILVELLLDDCLIQSFPEMIDQYYLRLQPLDSMQVEGTVSRIAERPVEKLNWFIDRFREVKFLYDYSFDEKLLRRLNQVMQRVKLLPLPNRLLGFFESARRRVAKQMDQLYFEPRRQDSEKMAAESNED